MQLSEKQKWSVHFFDERGNSVLSTLHVHAENKRLKAEVDRLKELLARVQQRRKLEADDQANLA